MLFPATCPCCGRLGAAPCGGCVTEMRRAPPVPVPPGLAGCRALLVYEGPARDLVARLKYRNARDSVEWLARGMAELVWPGDAAVAVTWAPTTAARRRRRGFDHAELLACRVAAELGLRCSRRLDRLPGPAQTGRSSVDRRVGPRFTAAPAGRRAPPAGTLLLVDDVVTTGATLAGAGRALRAAGADVVIGLVATYAPSLRARESAA